MSGIENTNTERARMALALEALLFPEGDGVAILAQEARGQAQLVASESLPSDSLGTDSAFEALGFRFAQPYLNDPLFRPAALPEGWTKRGTDHSMWSHVVDQHGRVRVNVFYKAAFYDRRANMSLNSVRNYVASVVNDPTSNIVLDEDWATRKAAIEALEEIEASEREYADRDWNIVGRDECLERAARAREMREAL